MMASSQVEISSPFVCRGRDRSCFQNNFIISNAAAAAANNNNIDYTDLWVHSPSQTQEKCNDSSSSSQLPHHHHHHHHQKEDKWARAREMVFSVDHSSSSVKRGVEVQNQNIGGVSSLVQKWRGLEAEAKCKGDINAPKSPSPVDDDSFGDWESDKTAFSGPASYRSSSRDSSDATERLRLRVSDIIRKLTEDRLTEAAACEPQMSEQRCFSPVAVVSSPRIRGRQAYNDLLMQMERDRHNELQGLGARKAVSKFSHRGRIQAMLRFRFLRRGIEAEENQRHLNAVHFRERVLNDPLMVNTPAMPSNLQSQGKENKHQESCSRVGEVQILDTENCTSSSSKDGDVVDPSSNQFYVQQNTPPFSHNCDHDIISPLPTSTRQETTSPAELAGTATTDIEDPNSVEITKDEEEVTGTNYEPTDNNETYWVSDVSHPEVGWEQLQSDYEEQQEEEEGSNREWIDEVSRPRSDWECLRQARYQEMLDPFSHNEDIRSLLARRSVSSFLSSGLREQIDQVIRSRSQGQHRREKERVEVITPTKDEQLDEDYGDYYDEYEEEEEEEEEEDSSNVEYNDYIDGNTSSAWPQEQGHQVNDYSSQLTASQQSLSSISYSPGNALNSSPCATTTTASRPAIEMEVIYELKGDMEQLRQEISELRKWIKGCMNMQQMWQCADGGGGGQKGRCRVCCKMQVDSVLYRCGHMCTCFKCGHELQWGNGKCPICRAPILDVVRTHSS